ncbi:MAG: hypothetical protein JKY70_20925 [Mucilaginibacter sp.]|nr:hypothetical protein [Mucilaginibacter sp.]
MENEVGLFHAKRMFNIVGIGLVVAGDIISGEIIPGDILKIPYGNISTNFEIDSVEAVDYPEKQSETGLILKSNAENTGSDIESIIQTNPTLAVVRSI